VFENRVLRIFGPKRYEITGKWKKLHNVALNNVLLAHYSSCDQNENEMGAGCSTYGKG
jgi:hypothetical protein